MSRSEILVLGLPVQCSLRCGFVSSSGSPLMGAATASLGGDFPSQSPLGGESIQVTFLLPKRKGNKILIFFSFQKYFPGGGH